jgi:ribonuclease HI
MPKRRKKKTVRIIFQSAGPLPAKFGDQYAGKVLVFSDASRKEQGGLAAILFADTEAPPIVKRLGVPLAGSNELEFQAAVFALSQAALNFPGRELALFSDNQDAVTRLSRAKAQGLAQDPALSGMLLERNMPLALDHAAIRWIKGHSSCRGNTLADCHAAEAARRLNGTSGEFHSPE